MYKRIVAAIDGSENSMTAATRAGLLAHLNDADLVLLHVTPDAPVPESMLKYARTEHLDQKPEDLWESVAAELLHRTEEHVRETVSQPPAMRQERRHGDAAEMIVEAANDMSAELIVVGCRGLSRVSGLLMGSVSQKIAGAASPVDLLIVR